MGQKLGQKLGLGKFNVTYLSPVLIFFPLHGFIPFGGSDLS